MNASVLFASLHHLAAFTVVAMLAVEMATFKAPFTAAQARRLQRIDTIFRAFVAAALISIYPTVIFLSWTKSVKAGSAPAIADASVTRVRMCLMLELTAIVVILPCAALMARGFGYR